MLGTLEKSGIVIKKTKQNNFSLTAPAFWNEGGIQGHSLVISSPLFFFFNSVVP